MEKPSIINSKAQKSMCKEDNIEEIMPVKLYTLGEKIAHEHSLMQISIMFSHSIRFICLILIFSSQIWIDINNEIIFSNSYV